MKAKIPADEPARLAALRSYDIIDTPAEKALDDLTKLASHICGTPIAMISLVDQNRQWFKSKQGVAFTETSRDIAFCAHGILQAEVLVVPDARADARFADSPLVTEEPRIRFYAGAPLISSDGHALGMICVQDQVPRELSPAQKEALEALSRQVVSHFELKKQHAELVRANEELYDAQQRLKLLSSAVEQAKESVLITDAMLEQPGPSITFVNTAFTKMTGYTAEEVMGKTPRILQGPKTDRAVLQRLRQQLQRGEVFDGETVNYRKDGSEFDLEWQIAPIRNVRGKITHFVAIQRDITERKQIESRLFQSQKMETVGRLAGGVAHEFNSILTAIIGQSELLITDLPAEGALAKSAREIRRAADRAATLTHQLLAYGRKQILQPEVLNINRVLGDMLGTLQHLVGREIEVRIVPAADLKRVRIDPGQMEQVLVSMTMNAADAMPHGGKLILETANVMLDEAYVRDFSGLKPGRYAMLAVTDTGVGMSPEVKARVFEPFFSTKGVGQGTGLGLATCYGIIKQSDGHIGVYSEVARGTTFKIYLPQTEQDTTRSLAKTKAPDLPGGTEKILLAEDDPSLLEMSASLLRRLGYTVLTAANGLEALSLKHQRDLGHIDLLLTDVVMPHMSGKELADRIHAIFPRTKILFTSAYTENAVVHQGMLNEGVDLLQKPFTPSALAHKVREVLDR